MSDLISNGDAGNLEFSDVEQVLLNAAIQENRQRIMGANPEIRRVIEATKDGKPVKIVLITSMAQQNLELQKKVNDVYPSLSDEEIEFARIDLWWGEEFAQATEGSIIIIFEENSRGKECWTTYKISKVYDAGC